jgi:hypothetical protein
VGPLTQPYDDDLSCPQFARQARTRQARTNLVTTGHV